MATKNPGPVTPRELELIERFDDFFRLTAQLFGAMAAAGAWEDFDLVLRAISTIARTTREQHLADPNLK